MPKKAVSPLIATVLVIGFAIALSGIMMTWGTSFVKDIQERSEKSSLKDIACTKDVGLNIKSATVLGNKIKLVIENLGQMNMDKLNILLVGSDGGDNIVTASGISAGGIQSFSVALDPNKIGTFKQVEAMPYVTFEGEQIACKDAVDKEENLGIDTDGLVAYYKLDGDAKDSAGNNNGVINGNPATVNGVFGNALDFDGIDDSVGLSNTIQFDSGDFVINGWFKTSADTTAIYDQIWNSGYNGGSPDAEMGMTNNKLYFYARSIGVVTGLILSETVLNDNQWHHFSGIRNGNAFMLSVDGLLGNPTTQPLGDVDSAGVIPLIGNGLVNINNRYFSGIIDEVKIYNKAKTY